MIIIQFHLKLDKFHCIKADKLMNKNKKFKKNIVNENKNENKNEK